MPNENFRRELGHVFEEMTGSPSAALPDRVRSSLANLPEQRAPFWIAGVAAAVIAALVVGIVVVGNINRPQNRVLPVGVPTTSPSASPTPDSTLPVFVCAGGSAQSTTPAPAVAFIDALRIGTHPGYDRLTIEFKNGLPGGFELRMQTGTTFTTSPKGDQVTLAGKNGILVVIRGADLHTNYSGSTDLKTGYAALVEVRQVEDFEGVVQLALGVSGSACYSAFTMTGPDRLVIDVKG
ncbi:MAG TPA: hypothetical protein VFH00_08950 [Candidatus Nitrosotalea sp.]|nr:hypothetical protein [Candidatus Nitrosotalea sp.]